MSAMMKLSELMAARCRRPHLMNPDFMTEFADR